ncbi:MAG: DMT family transporter [Symbiobacteriia bacterium]
MARGSTVMQTQASGPSSTAPGLGNAAGVLMVLGAGLLWGTIGLFSRWLYREGLTPMQVVAGRIALTWVVFVLAALGGDRRRLRIGIKDAGFFAAYGFVSVALFYGCWFYAVSRLPVAVAVILLYTAPAYVALLSVPLFGERLDRAKGMALALTLVGAALVAGRPEAAGPLPLAGILAGLGAGLTYGLYSLFGKAAVSRYSRSATLAYTFTFGLIGVAVAGGLAGTWAGPAPAWFGHPRAWLLLGGLALGPTVLAYYLYNGGLARIEAGRASIIATVEPVTSVLLAWLVLGEPLRGWQVLGGGLVLAAVVLLQVPGMWRGARPVAGILPSDQQA